MSSNMGISARIAKELEALRKELSEKNRIKLVDADREIVNVWKELKIKGIKGVKLKKEIVF